MNFFNSHFLILEIGLLGLVSKNKRKLNDTNQVSRKTNKYIHGSTRKVLGTVPETLKKRPRRKLHITDDIYLSAARKSYSGQDIN
ncbi:hypothetical protein CEXT_736861 [Caerostris extrusa]|uniref:Uncharacterized protein n=1 Tax=Caerostris extrusa TaxID=172846 RepID=A0AAV4UG67_CAEEX|nr:hypothetical protein CEXT_736861 [Caerostris extrusa]